MKEYPAPCGMICTECTAYIATKNGDLAMKQQMAIDYEKSMGQPIAVEDLDCEGCQSSGKHISFCNQCAIRSCTQEKGYKTCAECADFPCSKGDFIWVGHSKTKQALEALR